MNPKKTRIPQGEITGSTKPGARAKEATVPVNRILHGHALDHLRALPNDTIDMCVTSPPYWGLRDYGTSPQVWGGDPDCDHQWGEALEFHSIREGTTSGKSRTTERYCGASSRKFNGNHQKHFTSEYCRRCRAWRGELGLEPYFFEYIDHLCMIFEEVKRVLKPTGSLWVNLGDTYAGAWGNYMPGGLRSIQRPRTTRGRRFERPAYADITFRPPSSRDQGIPEKSLCQIPNRFAITMTDRGWCLRNEIVWWKPNCMPSSVKDRFTVDFEKIFFFTKSRKYYFETQYEPHATGATDIARQRMTANEEKHSLFVGGRGWSGGIGYGELGRNKRAVWRITTKPFPEAHFAVYPPDLVETPIRAGCPEWVCKQCGTPMQPIFENEISFQSGSGKSGHTPEGKWRGREHANTGAYDIRMGPCNSPKFQGYTDCGCKAGFEPGIVLDPFLGSGTTAVVALENRRHFIGIELNPDYIAIAKRRIQGVGLKMAASS